jgi:hypothetical protein
MRLTVALASLAVDGLAAQLYVDPGDVRVAYAEQDSTAEIATPSSSANTGRSATRFW